MSLTNAEIAAKLQQIADILEINGDNPYRVRAYRKAGRTIAAMKVSVCDMVQNNEPLTTLPNIGKGISTQIKIMLTTGNLPPILRKEKIKRFRNELKQIVGLGPKRIKLLNEQLQINTKQELEAAINQGKLRTLKGFNEKLEQKILASLAAPRQYEKFFRLKIASLIINFIKDQLEKIKHVKEVIVLNNFRRKSELVGNTDLIVTTSQPENLIKQFIEFDEIHELVEVNLTSATVILHSGMQITLRAQQTKPNPAVLIYDTGSDQHVAQLQKLALEKNMHLTKMGLYKNKEFISAETEKELYAHLDLAFIPPELRENRGEIQAAQQHTLPNLIKLESIKGDLHSHTNETDGTETLETMVKAAIAKGYEYLAITDHSKNLAITNGLDEKRLRQQIELIDELNSQLKNFTILKASEIDILQDGSLDFPDDVLKDLDIRVCSIHSRFKMSREEQTERIIRAMDNPYFNILGHPTGRLLQRREPYPIDIERILIAAKERGCFVELNAQPSRLDINDIYCKLAKEIGVKVAISSDAHSIREMDFMLYGIYQARRGWLEANDVINTRSLPELLKLLKR